MFAILLSVLAISADGERAAQKTEEPAPKVPPQLFLVKLDGDQIVFQGEAPVTRAVKRLVEVNDILGKRLTTKIVGYATSTEKVELKWDLKKAKAATAGGKKLGLDDLKKRLAKPQVVVVSGDGKPVDEAYLKLLDKDVIVLVPEKPKLDDGKKK